MIRGAMQLIAINCNQLLIAQNFQLPIANWNFLQLTVPKLQISSTFSDMVYILLSNCYQFMDLLLISSNVPYIVLIFIHGGDKDSGVNT